jgi:hypothetical protein
MPCYDSQAAHYEEQQIADLQRLREKAAKYESYLCAIGTVLLNNGTFQEVVKTAELNGNVTGINQFFEEHNMFDHMRLARDLHTFLQGFSKQEIDLIKRLILTNKGE